jgi:predicted Zn-dependent peptidase
MLSKGIVGYNREIEPIKQLYNSYFGGGMNSIVFQEMREARGLAYSANARYQSPSKPDKSYYLTTFIATQNDKMSDAVAAFKEILNNMPVSEKAFTLAKNDIITGIRTSRILRSGILWDYLHAEEFGYTYDARKDIFDKVQTMTLDDVKKFQETYVKDKPFTYCILGDTKDLDMPTLEKLGKITILSQQEIFGY